MSGWANRVAAPLLTGALLLPTGSCGPVPSRPGTSEIRSGTAAAEQQQKNIADFLESAQQKGATIVMDGNPHATLEDINKALHGKYTTVSFGFAGCENFCPMTNANLAALGRRMGDDLISVMVDVTPGGDAADHPHQQFKDQARNAGIGQKVVFVHVPNGADVIALQQELGNFVQTDPNATENHSMQVSLFDKNGGFIERLSGMLRGREFVARALGAFGISQPAKGV